RSPATSCGTPSAPPSSAPGTIWSWSPSSWATAGWRPPAATPAPARPTASAPSPACPPTADVRSGHPVAGFRRISAVPLQGALHAEAWPPETPLRVRLALHTGEADLRDGDYYGGAVNRAARLRAIVHGGQALLSQAVYDLVRGALPGGVAERHLALRAHPVPGPA